MVNAGGRRLVACDTSSNQRFPIHPLIPGFLGSLEAGHLVAQMEVTVPHRANHGIGSAKERLRAALSPRSSEAAAVAIAGMGGAVHA